MCSERANLRKVHSATDKYAEHGLRSLAVGRHIVPEKTKENSGGPWKMVGVKLANAKETGRRLGMGSKMYSSASILGQLMLVEFSLTIVMFLPQAPSKVLVVSVDSLARII